MLLLLFLEREFFYLVFESVSVDGAVAGLCAVVIDRLGGEAQETGDVVRVGDTEADEGKDTQFGGETVLLREGKTFLRTEQVVEIFYKVREEGEEGLIEMLVEVAQGMVGRIVLLNGAHQRFGLVGQDEAQQAFVVLVHLFNDVGALCHIACYIGISDTVGVVELGIDNR